MRPAYSVILFTTLSGAGYGMLAVLGAMLLVDARPAQPLAALLIGLGLASAGLVASTFHLGRPERAWRAFSQWRTSWLSREGMAALAVYAAAVSLGGLLIGGAPDGGAVRLLAAVMAVLATATVWCTAMIYASLKPVPQWRHPTVLPAYLLLAVGTGALMMAALPGHAAVLWPALLALLPAWLVKEAYWRQIAHPAPGLTAADATGLRGREPVRLLDPPHTESSYLLHEMGYRVGRRHAGRLRRISRIFGFAVPIAASAALLTLGLPSAARIALALLSVVSALVGTLAERWLFFAEARHTVMLYYGAPTV